MLNWKNDILLFMKNLLSIKDSDGYNMKFDILKLYRKIKSYIKEKRNGLNQRKNY